MWEEGRDIFNFLFQSSLQLNIGVGKSLTFDANSALFLLCSCSSFESTLVENKLITALLPFNPRTRDGAALAQLMMHLNIITTNVYW
jgi:hypothetical protein